MDKAFVELLLISVESVSNLKQNKIDGTLLETIKGILLETIIKFHKNDMLNVIFFCFLQIFTNDEWAEIKIGYQTLKLTLKTNAVI